MARREKPSAPSQSRAKAAAIARSGLRRYPRELIQSLQRPPEIAKAGDSIVLPPEHPHASAILAASWLGHATTLLRIGTQWVLTDPVFSHRIGVRIGPFVFGPRRVMDFVHHPELLPPIDLVLISHAHFDHLDRPSLAKLAKPTTAIVTAANTSRLIPRGFGDVRELKWGETVDIGPLTIGALRPAHWGARTAWDRHRGYNSYVIESRAEGPSSRVLYAGDTAYTEAFKEAGSPRLSVFGIGAYDPWIQAHATPEQVWEMHAHANGQFLLPIHHSTFVLSDEPLSEPMQRLLRVAGDDRHRVVTDPPGALWVPPSDLRETP